MTAVKRIFQRHREIILYGIGLAFLLLLLRFLELRFVLIDHSLEVYIGAIALVFTALGIWLARKLSKPKVETVVVEREVPVIRSETFVRDNAKVEQLGLSKRELEILGLMAEGLSNDEIADRLSVSLSTVKSHNQNLFDKLEVKRRTQAVDMARRFGLIP